MKSDKIFFRHVQHLLIIMINFLVFDNITFILCGRRIRSKLLEITRQRMIPQINDNEGN